MNPTSLKRQSNIELLRIVAMTMIVIHHIILFCCNREIRYFSQLNSLVICGVNMFVLITGYFGLKLKWRSVINLVSITLFYSILSTFAYCLYTDTLPSLEVLKKTLFPISSGTYWFVTSYFYLLLLSPLLNFALHAMSDRQLCFFLAVLIFINCISSWLFQNNFNPNGYNTMQFILLYYIGYCIKNTTAFALVQKNCIPCAVFFQILMVISS